MNWKTNHEHREKVLLNGFRLNYDTEISNTCSVG